MRKALTFFLFVIMLMQVMGYYIVFRLRQMELKSEVKMYLKTHSSDEHLTLFQFITVNGEIQDEQFKWEEEGEFSYAGNMYDVIDQKVQGNKLTVNCVQDKKENDLLKTFEQIQKRQTRGGKSRSASLLQFFGGFYISTEQTLITALPNPTLTYYCVYKSPLLNRSGEILTPPPKNC